MKFKKYISVGDVVLIVVILLVMFLVAIPSIKKSRSEYEKATFGTHE